MRAAIIDLIADRVYADELARTAIVVGHLRPDYDPQQLITRVHAYAVARQPGDAGISARRQEARVLVERARLAAVVALAPAVERLVTRLELLIATIPARQQRKGEQQCSRPESGTQSSRPRP